MHSRPCRCVGEGAGEIMTVIDPGHRYQLHSLDGGEPVELVFVKREGVRYPGNVGAHPGTNLQEVLRACIARLAYLDAQIHDYRTVAAIPLLRHAVELLEFRAAHRHGRADPSLLGLDVIADRFCHQCGHVGCAGECVQ